MDGNVDAYFLSIDNDRTNFLQVEKIKDYNDKLVKLQELKLYL
jgi:hypothetical protein